MLKLEYLKLRNFMAVSSADLFFENNDVILIVGENGSGKSTILEAIAFILADQKRGNTYSEYIKAHCNSANLELSFVLNGDKIRIEEVLTESKAEKKAWVNDETDPYVNSEVTTLLKKYDIGYFAKIILSMQGDQDITTLTEGKRKEFLQKLLEFDFTDKVQVWKDAAKDVDEKIKYNTNQIEYTEKTITERQNEIKTPEPLSFGQAEIDAVNADIERLTNEIADLASNMSEKDKLNKLKSDTLADITSKTSTITGLQSMNTQCQSAIISAENSITSINQYLGTVEVNKLEVSRLADIYSKLEKDAADINTELIKLKRAESAIDVESAVSEKDGLIRQQALADSEVAHATNHLGLIEKGVCPECGHTFDATDKVKYETASAEANKKLEDVKTKLAEATRNVAALQAKKNEATSAYNAQVQVLTAKNQELAGIKADIDRVQKSIDDVESQRAEKESLIQQNQKIIDDQNGLIDQNNGRIESLNKEIVELNKSVSDCDNKLAAFGDVTAKHSELNRQLSEKQAVATGYNNKLLQNSMILQNNETIRKNIEDMKKSIEDTKVLNEQNYKLKSRYADAIDLVNVKFVSYLILRTCKKLEEEMNKFINVIFPRMHVHLDQKRSGVTFLYTLDTLDIEDDNERVYRDAKMASGFEKACLSMAFKVSLCRAYNLTFSFMDEIDKDGTEENAAKLFESIIANNIFEQLFIISHKPNARAVVANYATNLKTYYVDAGKFTTQESK